MEEQGRDTAADATTSNFIWFFVVVVLIILVFLRKVGITKVLDLLW